MSTHIFCDRASVLIKAPRWGDASGSRGAARLWNRAVRNTRSHFAMSNLKALEIAPFCEGSLIRRPSILASRRNHCQQGPSRPPNTLAKIMRQLMAYGGYDPTVVKRLQQEVARQSSAWQDLPQYMQSQQQALRYLAKLQADSTRTLTRLVTKREIIVRHRN